MDLAKIQHMPVQIIPLADWTNGREKNQFPYPTFVIRYPVLGGWIVGTVIGDGDAAAFSQSFVPDPDYIWNPTFSADAKTSDEAQRP